MADKITYIVGTLSGASGVSWQNFDTKREALDALVGAISIQKVAPHIYVIKRKEKG